MSTALPTRSKTWQLNINQQLVAQASAVLSAARFWRLMKDSLIGFGSNPWTIVGSSSAGGVSSSSGMDAVDRWTADNQLIWAAAGANHAWIVLKQAGMEGGNFQLCIDASTTTTGNCTIAFSVNAGFTGGSNTARPTATDEQVFTAGTNPLSFNSTDQRMHVWQSTDGKCTRVQLWRSGTNLMMILQIETLQNPPTGWTYPVAVLSPGMVASGEVTSVSALFNATNWKCRGIGGTPNFSAFCTAEGTGVANQMLFTLTSVGTSVNSFDSSWPIFPVGFASVAAGNSGRLGTLYDLWCKPTGINNADTMPNDANDREIAGLGPLMYPWTQDSTVPGLS